MLRFPFSVLTAGVLFVSASPVFGEKSHAQQQEPVQVAVDPTSAKSTDSPAGKTSSKQDVKGDQGDKKSPEKTGGEKADEAAKGKTQEGDVTDNPGLAEKQEAAKAAVAIPVPAEPVQIFGWREEIRIDGLDEVFAAKLDSGALTSSVHAEEQELFERDGKKWVRFIVTDPTDEKPKRSRIEAPFVRMSRVKEPGGESTERMVVRLSFRIGERRMRSEFSLNNRSNMLAPVLIGRSAIKELGWVDAARVNLADDRIFR